MRLSVPLFLFILVACSGGGDDADSSPQQANVNRNTAAVEAFYTESTTPASVKASAIYGLEIPSLSTGSANAFIVHTLPDGTLNYCVGYNTQLKANCWTAFKWYNGFSSNDENWKRKNWQYGETFNGYGGNSDPFQPDNVLPQALRISSGDYNYSGYQRGHLLGSADRLNSKEANGQTFYMSNVHPQLAGFNEQGIWWNLENRLRDYYDRSDFRDTLYVVKGGTISEGKYKMVGSNSNLVCPDYFYMAILCYFEKFSKINSEYAAIAFWMEHKENADKMFVKYAISIDELEERTGIDFFCNLPDDIEDKVEGSLNLSYWRLNTP